WAGHHAGLSGPGRTRGEDLHVVHPAEVSVRLDVHALVGRDLARVHRLDGPDRDPARVERLELAGRVAEARRDHDLALANEPGLGDEVELQVVRVPYRRSHDPTGTGRHHLGRD